MKEFLMTTYTVSLPIVLGYIVWLLKEQKKARSANSEGTKCLLRVKLIEYHDRYVNEGSIPSYALENWVDMYNAYTALGGNGMVKGMDKEIHSLKIT
ncbi:MAG: hypothetical protein ACLRT4_18045 [Thomasclavelia sp.]